jgi:tRNA dimethylallyltransferase
MIAPIKIVVICGPTAVGKTSLAIDLAKRFNGEILSADSRQVYRYMDIGTDKPTLKEREQIPHHLIDFLDPDQTFSGGEFVRQAQGVIASLFNLRKNIFVVGGTGLYIKALLHGLIPVPAANREIRQELQERAQREGMESIYGELQRLDPQRAARLNRRDFFRVSRALEIYRTTGKVASQWHAEHRFQEARFEVYSIGLSLDRSILYQRIDSRVEGMIRRGLVEEVQALLKAGYGLQHAALRTPGYQEILRNLQGELPWGDVVELFKRRTRQYAKRQVTWFRADPEIHRFNPLEDRDRLAIEVERFLGNEMVDERS